MFVTVVTIPNTTTLYSPLTPSGTSQTEWPTLDDAKKAVERLLNNSSYKTTFAQQGYAAFIIDDEKKQLVSSATVPRPTLNWADTK